MLGNVICDTPRREKARKRAARQSKGEVDARLYSALLSSGMMTALRNVRSTRLRAYFAKPARLLNDGWRLKSFSDPAAVVYTLIGTKGCCQTLTIYRKSKQVQIDTQCPSMEQRQTILYSFDEDCIQKNSVITVPTKRRPRTRSIMA